MSYTIPEPEGRTPADRVKAMLNGSLVARVGATDDPGLMKDKHHVLPWNTQDRIEVRMVDNTTEKRVDLAVPGNHLWAQITMNDSYKVAVYNVDTAFGYQQERQRRANVDENRTASFRLDLIAILVVMIGFGYYTPGGESKPVSDDQSVAIRDQVGIEDEVSQVFNDDRFNRAV